MTDEQARIVFDLARDGLSLYVRGKLNGDHMGLWHADKLAALVALSVDLGRMFPDQRADGSFNIPRALLTT